jgi:hypothetical protein
MFLGFIGYLDQSPATDTGILGERSKKVKFRLISIQKEPEIDQFHIDAFQKKPKTS